MSEQGPVSPTLRVGRKASHTPFPAREELINRFNLNKGDANA